MAWRVDKRISARPIQSREHALRAHERHFLFAVLNLRHRRRNAGSSTARTREDHVMIRQTMRVMGVTLALLAGACATMQDSPARYTTVTIEKPVHFSALDGADVMAAPGRYHVDSFEDATLRLTPAESGAGSSPLIVAAMALPHAEPIESRVALSLPNGEDEHHVVLLMPDGKGLDAGGTYSGLRSRGGNIRPLPNEMVMEFSRKKWKKK